VRESEMSLIRALCYRKPASYYRRLGEEGMRKCLFYGIHPGGLQILGSPGGAEQARPLFRKYAPLIRTIAQAGWQPVTCAEDRAGVAKVERWGAPEDVTYFTLRNFGEEDGSAELSIDLKALGLAQADLAASELVEAREVTTEKAAGMLVLTVPIKAGETLLVRLGEGE